MTFKKKLISAAVAIALTSLIVGCGDSKKKHGGSDSDETPQTVSGVVVKGIFRNANVVINEIVNGTRNQLGTAVTDDNGNYEVTLERGASSGVIEIVVSPGSNSSMVCDVVDGCGSVPFGGSIPVAAGSLTLKAIVAASADQTTVSTAVSPLTHMAAARVEELGTFSEANINVAANEVLAITGIDIRTSIPLDITDEASLATASTVAKQQALYLAGLADILIASDGSVDTSALADLAESFSDGELSNEDSISLGDVLDAVENATENVPASVADELTEAITAIENKITEIKTDPEFTDDLDEHEELTAIARAKSLVANTRAWLSAIKDFREDFDNGSYESSVNMFFDEEAIKNTIDEDTQRAAQLSGEILNQTLDALDLPTVRATLESGEPYPLPISNDAGDVVGELVVRVDDTVNGAAGIAIILSGTLDEENNVVVNDLTLSSNLTLDSFNEDYTLFETFTSNEVNLQLTGGVTVGGSSVTFNSVAVDINATEDFTVGGEGETSDEEAEAIFDSMTLNGNILISTGDGTHTFNGEVALELDALLPDVVAESVVSLKSVELAGEFTSPTGSFDISTSLLVSNSDRFDTFGFADHEDFFFAPVHLPGDQSSATDETLIAAIEEASGEDIEAIDVYYSFYNEWWDVTEFGIGAHVADFETEDYFLQGVLTVSTAVDVEGLPAADAIVSVGRTALNGAYAQINLSWEGERYTFAIEAPDLDGEGDDSTATLTVTDQAGVAMTLNLSEADESVSGTVIVDGRQVGTISDSSGVPIIRYNDGNETSFESLF